MKYSSLLLSSAFLASSLSYADYFVEIDAALALGSGARDYESDFGDNETDYDTSGSFVGATVYFGPVSTNDVPINEAAFLSKQSFGAFFLVEDEVEWDDGDERNENDTFIAGRAVVHDTVILGAAYGKGDHDSSIVVDSFFGVESVTLKYDSELIGFEVGAYLSDTNAFVFSYSKEDFEWDSGFDAEIDTVGITFQQVDKLGGAKHIAWSVGFENVSYETNFGREEDQVRLDAGLTFYFTNRFGAGARLATVLVEGEDSEYDYDGAQTVFMPHLAYEINENVGVYLVTESQATILEYDDGDEVTDASLEYTFGLNVRF